MRTSLVAGMLSLAAFAAHAQSPSTPGPVREEGRAARPGPHIRIDRPDISLAVRCGEGETTKSCGEIVVQLLEKLPAAPSAGGGDRRDGVRDSDRHRGGWYRDADRDGRERGARDTD